MFACRKPVLKACLYGVSLVCLTVGLAACGGGDGAVSPRQPPLGPTPPPPPPPPPTSSEFDTPEFRENYGLNAIDAIPAYEAGGTGEGAIVGVIDSGIDLDHFDLQGRIHPSSTDIIARDDVTVDDQDGHGTQVSGIIAANRNDRGIHGVAFESQVLMVRTDDAGTCDSDDDCMFADFDIASGIDLAVANGARVINLSLGGDEGFSTFLRDSVANAVRQGVVVVVSAGNDSLSAPSSFAEFALEPDILGGALIVGATNQFNQKASFSNEAGNTAKDVFLVAPGSRVITTHLGGRFATVSGTSFAAPHVAGAAAVLFDLFPNLSGREVVQILLSSARDLGAVGVDSIFGHGLLDLGTAIEPQGQTAVATANGADPQPTAASGTASSTAYGDALQISGAFDGVVMTDKYDRAYQIDLSARITSTPVPAVNLERLQDYRRATESAATHLMPGHTLSVSKRDHNRFSADPNVLPRAVAGLTERNAVRARYSAAISERTTLSFARGYADDTLLPDYGGDGTLFLTGRDDLAPLGAENSLSFAAVHRRSVQWSYSISATHLTRQGRPNADFGPLRTDSKTERLTLGAHYVAPNWTLGIDSGAIIETNSVLGARSSGALRIGDGATTAFARLSGVYELMPGLSLQGRLSGAVTAVDNSQNSLINNVGHLLSSRFSAAMVAEDVLDQDDRLGLSVSQPVRIESGHGLATVPVAMDYRTETFEFADRRFSLTPSAREIDVELGYRTQIYGFDVNANVMHQFDAGHSDRGTNVSTVLFRLGRHF